MTLVSTNKPEKNTVVLEIQVGPDEFKPALDRAYQKNAKKISLPGFRPGKAPRHMVEKLYGSLFQEDAVNELFPKAYEDAAKEAGIEPVDRADVEIKEITADGFTFTATVTVKPEVKISSYKGLKATKKEASVDESEVDNLIEALRDRNARMKNIDDRAAQLGDTANIDFEGFCDGVAFEGGKGDNYPLILGSGSFIPGFEDQIVGHNVGEEFDVNVTFPKDYQAENLKGKDAVFKVKLNSISLKELPELDDEFAKDVSEFDTYKELREDARKQLLERATTQIDEEFEDELLTAMIENLEADIPQVMFENKADELVNDFGYRMQSQGLDLDTYLKYIGQSKEELRNSFKPQAEKHVKVRLALEAIAKAEKIEVSDEDVDKELEKLANNYGMDLEQVKAVVNREDVVEDIAVAKAIELVKANAKVSAAKKPAAKKTASKKKEEPAEEKAEKPAAKKPAAKKTTSKKKEEPAEEKAEKPAAKKPAAKKTTKKAAEEK